MLALSLEIVKSHPASAAIGLLKSKSRSQFLWSLPKYIEPKYINSVYQILIFTENYTQRRLFYLIRAQPFTGEKNYYLPGLPSEHTRISLLKKLKNKFEQYGSFQKSKRCRNRTFFKPRTNGRHYVQNKGTKRREKLAVKYVSRRLLLLIFLKLMLFSCQKNARDINLVKFQNFMECPSNFDVKNLVENLYRFLVITM